MGRSPCCDDKGLKKGPWTQEEDEKLTSYIQKHGHGSWRALPKNAGLNRCGKSCRLRWTNYLRPDIKRGRFTEEEEEMIIKLHSILGNKWSRIAAHLPGRTDNEIKNYWNTHLRKKLLQMGIDPVTHRPRTDLSLFSNLSHLLSSPMSSLTNDAMMNNYPHDLNALRLQSNTAELAKIRVLQNIISILHTSPAQNIDQSAVLLGLSSNNNNQQLIEKLLACPNPNPNGPSSSMNTPPISDEALPGHSIGASGATKSETEQCGAFYESWAGIGGENYSDKAMKMDSYEQGCSSGNPALAEHKLPGLVSASSTETWSINENIASNANSTLESIQSFPADADFLEGWEKLIDDGTSESFFWKDLLN